MRIAPHSYLRSWTIWCLGIDFMGHFMSSFGNKHIFVFIDYVSKWVKAVALPNNEGNSVV